MTGDYENKLYPNSYQIIYDKLKNFEKINDEYFMQEINITKKFQLVSEDSVPYFRFPRSKDGISIPRLIYNIFKVFKNDNVQVKPQILIPIIHNVYSVVIRENT